MSRKDQEQALAVRAVIESYVKACRSGDTMALRALFHDEASMSGFLGGAEILGTPEPFFDAVAQNPAPQTTGLPYEATIKAVIVSDRIGTVELHEQGYLGMNFINHFHLMLEDGQWYITAKLFESAPENGRDT
ncbi:nuclear transport factor 2 family protein [Parahaliea mediterranea]|uniref:nuclear transport factor 2 family protein n=1 Tax=Parahaliea mediterranea TaxID=651086 RepID=UPI0013004A6F|nr:nuclear transport factor 2 family protein [Parahaliea mediterranea]